MLRMEINRKIANFKKEKRHFSMYTYSFSLRNIFNVIHPVVICQAFRIFKCYVIRIYKWGTERQLYPVSTRRRFDVHATSITLIRRRMDVKTTSCAYWEGKEYFFFSFLWFWSKPSHVLIIIIWVPLIF